MGEALSKQTFFFLVLVGGQEFRFGYIELAVLSLQSIFLSCTDESHGKHESLIEHLSHSIGSE